MKVFVPLLCALAVTGSARAQSWELRLTALAGSGTRDLSASREPYRGLTVDGTWAQPAFGGKVRLRAAADAPRWRGDLREAAYDWRASHWGFSAGRQNIAWGRADGFNPTDVWTPRSHDRASLADADQYRGADTLRLWRDLGAGQISVLASPHFRPSRQGSGLMRELPIAPAPSHAAGAQRPAVALRWEAQAESLDYSVTWVSGAEPLPYFRPGSSAPLEARHGKLAMLGGDFANTAGAWVIRGEAAWHKRESDAAGLAPADSLHAVLGVEREVAPDWTANVQWLGSRHRQPAPVAPPLQPLADLNRALFHQQRPHYSGLSFGLHLNPAAGQGHFGLNLVAYRGGERLLRLRAEYPVSEFRLGVLLERFHGPAGSTFDFLSRNNIAWLTLAYTFGKN
jgi:hypothetical protein